VPTTSHPTQAALPGELADVRGWFPNLDQVLFDWLLNRQDSRDEPGDLLEMGVYLGKSSIFLGHHLREGETLTVCDLFESPAPDGHNNAETAKSYSTLTRDAFERNYLSFHDELPRVIHAPSSVIPDEVAPKSCRFVHVDASHLYEHVHGDIGAARDALLPGGVVVLDDFRSEHTPGVAVATWEAMLNRGLNPICLSTQKFYGTWDDPEPVQEELLAMLRARKDCGISLQHAAGHRLVRVHGKGMAAPPFPRSRHYATPAAARLPAASPTAPSAVRARTGGPSRARRLAVDVLPPFVTRAIRTARRRALSHR
jgi:hypothetical protein